MSNLIITRREDEAVFIGDAKVTILSIKGKQARISIEADPSIVVLREEVKERIEREAEAVTG